MIVCTVYAYTYQDGIYVRTMYHDMYVCGYIYQDGNMYCVHAYVRKYTFVHIHVDNSIQYST